MSQLSQLRYLNLRNNLFRDFPTVLCAIPNLEILDISRNKISTLPADFGTLVNLKVLSIAKNRIKELPRYFASMQQLKILKMHHNPFVYPPREITEQGTADMDPWLERLKDYLVRGDVQVIDPELPSELNGNSSESDRSDKEYEKRKSSRVGSVDSLMMAMETRDFLYPRTRSSPDTAIHQQQHHHKNSSSSLMIPRRRHTSSRNSSGDFRHDGMDLIKRATTTAAHQRGASVDSISSLDGSPVECDKNIEMYFIKLPAVRLSLQHVPHPVALMESCRGVLFSLGQVYRSARLVLGSCSDTLITKQLKPLLVTVNDHALQLCKALVMMDRKMQQTLLKPDTSVWMDLITTTRQAFASLKHFLQRFKVYTRLLVQNADMRLMRELLLHIQSSSIECKASTTLLLPASPSIGVSVDDHTIEPLSLAAGMQARHLIDDQAILATPRPRSRSTVRRHMTVTGTTHNNAVDRVKQHTSSKSIEERPTVRRATAPTVESSSVSPLSPIFGHDDDKLKVLASEACQAALFVMEQITRIIADVPNTSMPLEDLKKVLKIGSELSKRLHKRVNTLDAGEGEARRTLQEELNVFLKVTTKMLSLIRVLASKLALDATVWNALQQFTPLSRDLATMLATTHRQVEEDEDIPSILVVPTFK